MSALDEMAVLVAEAFTHYEPMLVVQHIPVEDFVDFIKLLGSKAEQEKLTVIARVQDTNELIGAIVTDDFASPPPEGIDQLNAKFAPIFALLNTLDEHYKQAKSIHFGEYLHLFMVAVKRSYSGRKVAQNLIHACLENGIKKGYKFAVSETTGLISQHIFKNDFHFVERNKIRYEAFTFEGTQPFKSIENHTGTILMDKGLSEEG